MEMIRKLLISACILASTNASSFQFYSKEMYGLYAVPSNQSLISSEVNAIQPIATSSGKYVIFNSASGHNYDELSRGALFIKNTQDHSVSESSLPNGISDPSVLQYNSMLGMASSDGRYLTLYSSHHAYPESNGYRQLYLWDLVDGSIDLITRNIDGLPISFNMNSVGLMSNVSDDGNYVYFHYTGRELNNPSPLEEHGQLYLWDRKSDTKTRLNIDIYGEPAHITDMSSNMDGRVVSGNGRYFLYATTSRMDNKKDNKGLKGLYLYDRVDNEHTLISTERNSDEPLNVAYFYPSISLDGKFVVFNAHWKFDDTQTTSGLYYVVKYDVVGDSADYGVRDLNGKPISEARMPKVSNDGISLAFISNKMGKGLYQAYFYDSYSGQLHLASISEKTGEEGNSRVDKVDIVADGSGLIWTTYSRGMKIGESEELRHRIYMYGIFSDICYF